MEIGHSGSARSLGTFPKGNDVAVISAVLDDRDRLYQLGGNSVAPPLELKRFTARAKDPEVLVDFAAMAIEPLWLLAP